METGKASKIFEFGPFRLDGNSKLLFREGELVSLPPKVLETLLILVENAGELVDKETLLRRIWPDTFVEENNLAQNISVLRRTFGDNGSPFIETVPKKGYRFVAPIAASSETRQNPGPVTGRGRWRWAAVALAAALTISILLLTRRPVIESIAILPLQNLSGDPQQDYLVDGITELLTTSLSRIGSLRVISRTSAMQYRATKKKAPEIARELRADALLEGSLMRSGDRIRVVIQLIRGATDEHLWSEVYERDLKDASDLQLEIARAIAHHARLKLTERQEAWLNRHASLNRAAFEEYLRGRHAWNKRSPENIKKAISHFQKAIDLDAAYAPSYAGLADAYNQLCTHLIGERPANQIRPLAVAAATKAISIAPDLAEAHASLGFAKMYDWDWPSAEKELRRAIELSPSYGPVRIWYASFLSQHQRHAEAIAQAHHAADLDPLSLIVRTQVGWIYSHAGQLEKAMQYFQDVLEKDPNYLWAQWQMGQAYLRAGRFEEATRLLEKAAETSRRNPSILGTLGATYARAGRRADAEKILQELTEMSKHRYVSPHAFSWVYLGLDDADKSFEWLEKEVEERSNSVAWCGVWHMLDKYRSDPRYLDLMRRIGLPLAGNQESGLSLSTPVRNYGNVKNGDRQEFPPAGSGFGRCVVAEIQACPHFLRYRNSEPEYLGCAALGLPVIKRGHIRFSLAGFPGASPGTAANGSREVSGNVDRRFLLVPRHFTNHSGFAAFGDPAREDLHDSIPSGQYSLHLGWNQVITQRLLQHRPVQFL